MSHHNFLKACNVFVYLFFLSSNLYSLLGPEAGEPYYKHTRITYLTPAPFTFAIWGLIYALLGGFVIYQWFEKSRVSLSEGENATTKAVGPAFIMATLLNSMWFAFMKSEHYILATFMMAGVTLSISYVYYALDEYKPRNAAETAFIHAPFSLWHAWSVVTLLLNIFAVFTRMHDPLHPGVLRATFAIATMAFLASTAVAYTEVAGKRKGDVAGAMVIAWVFFGIYANQPAAPIHWTALGLGILVTVYALKPFVMNKIYGTREESAPLLR